MLLTPVIGYWGIIVSEPIVWAVMVIPLIVSMVKRMKRAFVNEKIRNENSTLFRIDISVYTLHNVACTLWRHNILWL